MMSHEGAQLAEANRRLEHFNRVLKAIRNVNQLIVSEDDPLSLIRQACVNLTETMGYYNSWIALLGGETARSLGLFGDGPLVATAASGVAAGGFDALRERLHRGEFPRCMARALESSDVFVVDSPEDDCPECPLSGEYGGRAALIARMEHDGVTWGVLTASVPVEYAGDFEAKDLFSEVACDLAFALSRIAASRKLAESRRHMDFVVEGSGAGTWEWNLVSNDTRFNEQWASMLGYTLEELTPYDYETWARLVHPGDLEQARDALTDCISGRTPGYSSEYRMRHKGGGWVWILDRGRVMTRDESGKPLVMFGTHTDITDLKHSQEVLLEKEKRLNLAMESASEGLWEWDFTTELISFDKVALGMLGYEAGFPSQTGEWWMARIHAEDRPVVEKKLAAFIYGEAESYSVEFRIRTKGGDYIWVASTARIVRVDEQGKPQLMVGICRDITERRQADARLRESELKLRTANKQLRATEQQLLASNKQLRGSEERYRALYENAPIMLGVLDSQGRYQQVNETAYQLLGYTRKDLLNKTSFDFVHPDDQDSVIKAFSELRTAGVAEVEYRFRHSRGEYYTLSSRAAAIPGTDHFLVYSLDITKRKEGETLIADLARFPEENTNPVFRVSSGGILMYANAAALEILPESGRETGKTVAGEWLGTVEKALNAGDKLEIERNLGSRVFAVTLAPVPERGYVNIYARDISGHKAAERQLRLQSLVLDQIEDCVTVTDLNGVITYVNEAEVRRLGYARNELIGVSTEKYGEDPQRGATQRQILTETLKHGKWRGEVVNRTADGKDVILDARIHIVFDEEGNRIALAGVSTDITEQKASEEALRESESRFRGIFENSPSGIALVGLDYRVQASNKAYHDLLGRDESEVQYLSLKDFTHPDDLEENLRLQSRLGRGEIDRYSMEKRFIQKNGDVRWGYLTACLLRDSNGKPHGFLGHVVDITEQKQAEERLQQVARLESVGRLAGGVAHDFNNMLMGIMGYADMCRSGLPAEHEVRPWVDEITRAAERSADLTRQLLGFARKQTIAPRELDLNLAVEGIIKMLRRLIGEDIDLLWQPGSLCWRVCMDPGQIDQILANLCVNARDAIGGAGKVTIETEIATVDGDYCSSHSEAREGEYVVLIVSDDGCGMNRDTLEHVFEPFFTTKEDGTGTGLGLATVYGIVKQNQGFINVYSEPGSGSSFRIYLPRSEGATESEEAASGISALRGGTETILLTEDEKSIREILELFLKDLGYRVLSAESPEAALGVVDEHGADIDLLITDVVMPGMSGRELAEALQPEYPSMRVLYMSGYTANVIAHHGILEKGVQFLSKPISRDALARKVREILDGN